MVHPYPLKVLIIESNIQDTQLIKQGLNTVCRGEYFFSHAETLDEALGALKNVVLDVILVNLSLPDSQGPYTLARIHLANPCVPIIVLGDVYDEALAIEAAHMGAQDYLDKEQMANGEIISRSIRYALERKKGQERLAYLAHFDPLTGLPNRTLFFDRMAQALNRARQTQECVALMFLDLDHFKTINDSLGHDKGDILLKAVADRLNMCFRGCDTVARMGGDEFTMVLENVHSLESVASVARRILNFLAAPVYLDGKEFFTAASIGITMYPADDGDIQTLLQHADIAMYLAKQQGGNGFQFYLGGMGTEVSSRLTLVNDMHRALGNHEFFLHYQPLIDLRSGTIIGMESLLRWHHPDRGLISPREFIPVAEEMGLIGQLGQWVLYTACSEIRSLEDQGIRTLPVAVNISTRQFRQKDMVEKIEGALQDTGLSPQLLELELTEDFLMEDTPRNIAMLEKIRDMGVKISIDDFGTGYSSLRYLKSFPISTLKIDQSFIQELPENAANANLVKSMIGIGHSLGLTVLAEGVETASQLNFLLLHGCDQAQGFFFAHPQSMETLLPFLTDDGWIQRDFLPNAGRPETLVSDHVILPTQ